MNTITINSIDELRDIIFDKFVIEGDTDTSVRWGYDQEYIFKRDGKHYCVTVNIMDEEGITDIGSWEAYEVRPVEKVVTDWVLVQ